MSGHVQSEVSNEHCTTPVTIIVLGGKDIEHNVIKTEVKEETELSSCTEEMEMHSFTCEEHLKSDESEYKEDMLDIESWGLMDDEDIKYEVLEEAIVIEEHELVYKEDGQLEESESAECLELMEAEGAVSVKKREQIEPGNIGDGSTLAPGGENIPEKQRTQRTVREESLMKSIATHMLQGTETTEINSQVTIDTIMYTAKNRGNVNVNSDNDCTRTKIDVDNSEGTHSKMYISDDDKCLVTEYTDHNYFKNIDYRDRLHQQKQRRRGTGVRNKQTETNKQQIHYECEICQRKFKYRVHLNSHLRTHSRERLFECDICKVRFNLKSTLKTHLRIHTGEKPFECEICKVRFRCRATLNDHNLRGNFKIHLRTNTGKKLFECNICQRIFKYRTHLNTHLRTHSGETPFECDICKVRFKQKCILKAHLKTHFDEKPFKCEICQTRFKFKRYLKTHCLIIHSDEKPFQCVICQIRFKLSSNLKTHLHTHTGERPFECEICKVRFNLKGNLKRHLRTHTGETPFECEICKVRFRCRNSLNRHLGTHECDMTMNSNGIAGKK